MKQQIDSYSCGAAAIANALRCYGERISVHRAKIAAETDPIEGTDAPKVISGLAKLGYVGHSFNEDRAKNAWGQLMMHLKKGQPCILCVDRDQHWITVIGTIGEHVIVFDGTRTKANLSENGVHIYTKKTLTQRWRHNGKFFGIGVEQ